VKRLLLDINIVLDVLLDREPYVQASAAVWNAAENGLVHGLLSAHALTTIHYLIKKSSATLLPERQLPNCCKFLMSPRLTVA
jgi:predicted nucleic acid-binding protein